MENNKRYRLHPAVFYRTYADDVILYHTESQKVFTFNSTAADVLECFNEWNGLTEAMKTLKNIYNVEDNLEFENSISVFVEELCDKDILEIEYTQVESKDQLESEFATNLLKVNQLYSATFELTYKCNEKCRHCYIADSDKTEISTEMIKSILDELAELNALNIVFTGGEIFTRKDIWEILDYAYKKHFVIDIFTNGNLLNADGIIHLKSIWPRTVHFSVYSHIPEKHDSITQVKGSFDKTIRAIKACKLVNIPVNIKTPIFNETKDDIEGIVDLANSIGVSIELGANITPKKDGNLAPLSMKIKDEKEDLKVHEEIDRLIKQDKDTEIKTIKGDKICGAGERSISINPYGEVFPCNMLQLKIGDLNTETVKSIWQSSSQLKWWRKNNLRINKKGCEDCKYFDNCIFCPGEAMMRSNDPLKKYEDACIATQLASERKNEKGGL